MKKEKFILLVSAILFVAIVIFALLFSKEVFLTTNLVFIGVLALILPYSLYKFFEFKKIKQYEDQLPNFLRDLAESQRAGLTILQALQAVSKNDYGPLTSEIKKMMNQLSWNVPLEIVLRDFSKRMEKSRIIVRALMIIEQSNKSGGDIDDTMDSLATNIETIKDVQEEKAVLLNQQVIMMYAIFFIFLGISIALLKFLIPILQTNIGGGGDSLSAIQEFNPNPCDLCKGNPEPGCIGCTIFQGTAVAFDFGEAGKPESYYRSLFFIMILVQGFFSGLIAGQISSDSVTAGVKHSLIMTLTGFFVYILVVKTGLA